MVIYQQLRTSFQKHAQTQTSRHINKHQPTSNPFRHKNMKNHTPTNKHQKTPTNKKTRPQTEV